MSKHPEPVVIDKKAYKKTLNNLQIELVKLQNHIIKHNNKILLIFEGRDADGKDGTIKRITQHLSPRETRVVALGKPSDRDMSSWYFQRYVTHLPNEYHEFLETVSEFEQMLVRSGIKLFKYYLDISLEEQKSA